MRMSSCIFILPELMHDPFAALPVGFFFFFKGANKHFLSGFFSLPIVFFFNPLAARSVPAVLSATEVEAARGVF